MILDEVHDFPNGMETLMDRTIFGKTCTHVKGCICVYPEHDSCCGATRRKDAAVWIATNVYDKPEEIKKHWMNVGTLEDLFRPRDEFDVDVDPDSVRGRALALLEAYEATPRWLRWLSRVAAWRPWQ